MSTRSTDAASAVLVALAVWAAGRADGRKPRELLRPRPFLLGVVTAIAVEIGFARWPERTRRLWRHPLIRFGSPIGLVSSVLIASRHRGAAPVAATLGGIAGYFLLLVGVVLGVVPEPSGWFEDS